MRNLSSKLKGGRKITTYNTTIPAGHNTSGTVPVNVYFDTAIWYSTTYSHTTSVGVSGTRTTSHITTVLVGEFPEQEYIEVLTSYDTAYSTTSSWTTSYSVDTWYPQQTYRVSEQPYEYWTDYSYSVETWRETSW